jgi:hypothetical protein
MRSIAMHPYTVCIDPVRCIAADMIPPIDNLDAAAGLGQRPGVGGSGETGSDDQDTEHLVVNCETARSGRAALQSL